MTSRLGTGKLVTFFYSATLQPMVPVDGVSPGAGGEDDQGPVAPAPLLTGNTAHPSIYEKSNSLDSTKTDGSERDENYIPRICSSEFQAVLRIRNFYPGSQIRIFSSRIQDQKKIPDPESGSASKNLSTFNPQNFS